MPLVRAVAAALVASAALAGSASADPLGPGRLDLTFAGDGTLRTSLGVPEVSAVRALPRPGGGLDVLTSGTAVVRFTPAGRLDRRFGGRRGHARIRLGGDSNSGAHAIARDVDGSLVVAGTQRTDAIAVRRLDANGRRDRSFRPFTRSFFSYVSGVDVVPAGDGTVLVGGVLFPAYPATPPTPVRLVVLAIDRTGGLVAGFGEGGVATLALPRAPGWFPGGPRLLRLPDGRLRYAYGSDWDPGRVRPTVAGLTADGKPDPALGPHGVRELGRRLRGLVAGVASDATGRVLLAGTESSRRRSTVNVLAVLADGRLDPAFGSGGVARIALGFPAFGGGMAVDADGRLAISVLRSRRPRRTAVVLLRPDGSVVRAFGRRGVAVVGGFRRRRAADLFAVSVDSLNRLVLAGLSGDGLSGIREDFGRDYLALARLRLRRAPLRLPARAAVTRGGALLLPIRCRAAAGCRGEVRVSRSGRRARAAYELAAGRSRTLRIRLRGARGLAARRVMVRVGASVTTAGRTEPLAVRTRLRPR